MSAPIVVILAAGQGTRMRSSRPKVLHDLCGVPMVMWPVRAALAAGAQRVIVVDGPDRALAAVLPDTVELAVQERPDGTGGAAAAAMAAIAGSGPPAAGTPVVILSGDVPLVSAETIAELLRAHESDGLAATMASTILEDPSGYGRVVRADDGRVLRVVETKVEGDATAAEREIREVNTGLFVFDAAALARALPALGAENAQGERYLPQVLDALAAEGAQVGAHVLGEQALVLGVNDRRDLARVREIAQLQINERHMAAGVGIVDPRATVIDVDVEIGQDTAVEPFTTIHGRTVIGRDCTIRHSYLLDCVLEDGVSVGPFAYLRPGTVLRSGTKVGTFVEVKNSAIGPAAKVPHLSYIGDADVGEGTNLGAATITANYDGHAKHRTWVGADVRTGVDTTLVAPVSVGDGAYTGAGSVITDDVPDGALGIARERQRTIEGYAERAPGRRPEGSAPR
ncbi:MAG TPA: bifunctional UDP-N-acetylglucosamine diphosphorylase/glucosamine-1-phosphate N-acetyltransferase GlmU [Solirubrobacteraceae bacterium]|nr:bifunctional UDP-N-acetylglucosamine diphosphorylase/glucosamine-1-phosphate N-acetyltransferase GlmU [Solirubrobacteraceae bacterium]